MGKYKRDKGLQIPMEQRQNLNAKILYLVENHETELYGITPEDIFNVYMGNGGLHGLDRKDFQNFHAYTEAKKEIEQGQFFTPAEICEFLVACVKPEPKDIIYDLTYGKGDFFNYLPTESNIYGTEIDMKAVKIAQYLYPKANLQYGDIRQYSPVLSGDIVFGNPPFPLTLHNLPSSPVNRKKRLIWVGLFPDKIHITFPIGNMRDITSYTMS